ncbi:hypothetical protein ACX80O_05315 [Arthrobacter sp. Hz1]
MDSSTAAALGSLLLLQAEMVEEIASRLVGGGALEWDSPAGRNFGDYVLGQACGVRRASDLLREAATQVGSFASALRSLEYSTFIAQS